jgi:hypothetical protein
MNAKERAKRDLDIYLARIRGFSWATIGRSFKLNPRQCQRVVKQFRKGLPSVFQESALDLIDERLRMYEADISDLAEIALHARTPAQKAKAISAKGRVVRDSNRFLLELGVLPRPGFVTLESVGRLAKAIGAVLREFQAPADVREAVLSEVAKWAEEEGVLSRMAR